MANDSVTSEDAAAFCCCHLCPLPGHAGGCICYSPCCSAFVLEYSAAVCAVAPSEVKPALSTGYSCMICSTGVILKPSLKSNSQLVLHAVSLCCFLEDVHHCDIGARFA